MRKLVFCFLCAMGFLFGTPSALSADCSSSQCTDCGEDIHKNPKCVFVFQDAFCTCDLIVFGGTLGCGVDGTCDYTGGGGGGQGGGGGGGTTCTRAPGGWCPAECSSCETVYWY